MTLRTERISQQLREEVVRSIRDDVSDVRVKAISVLNVDVAPDLSNAVVYWSLFEKDGDPDKEQVEQITNGLASAAGFMRNKIAKRLALRRTPALRFRYDASLRMAGETMELLQAIKHGEETE